MDRPFLYLSKDFANVQSREARPQLLYGLLSCGLVLSVRSKENFLGALRIGILILLRSVTKKENYPVLWVSLMAGDLCHTLTSSSSSRSSRRGQDVGEVDEDPVVDQSVLSTWLRLVFFKSTFFALGGSNSLATSVFNLQIHFLTIDGNPEAAWLLSFRCGGTIETHACRVDLSNAYNGLKSFSLPIVTILTFLSNFSGPLIVGLEGLIRPMVGMRGEIKISGCSCRTMILVRSAYFSLLFLVISILSTHFSDHLFVFTVFSPAVLYAFVWLFGFHTILSLFEYTLSLL
ncbi:hypothetical protein KEM48_005212 [Puccinia striiformis f. sp. tritici PST-130]|nr:hypothetical protein KEM48_005212 [Puccinia striiformis f. sp. tritici PST-130]